MLKSSITLLAFASSLSAQINPNTTALPHVIPSYTNNGGVASIGPGAAADIENTLAQDLRPQQFLMTCGTAGSSYTPASGQYVIEATCPTAFGAATGVQVRDSASNIIKLGSVTGPSMQAAVNALPNCSTTGSDWSQALRDQQCVLPVPARPTGLGVYQTNGSAEHPCPGSGSCTLTLPSSPVQGDLILASFVCAASPTITASGWTAIGSNAEPYGTNASMYSHTVGPSETSSYTFTISGGNYCTVGSLVEWANANPSITQSIFTTSNATSLTPSVIGQRAQSVIGTYGRHTYSAGGSWTLQSPASPTVAGNSEGATASYNSASTDTSTPISVAWNNDDPGHETVGMVLISPYVATPTFVAGTGAGATPPTITRDVGSNATSGGFTLTVASGAAAGTFFTATYANTLTTAPFGCRLVPRNDASAAIQANLSQLTSTITAFSYRVASSLTSGAALSFAYGCQ